MKVKDLRGNVNVKGLRVEIPKKFENPDSGIVGKMYVESYWCAGIWFKKTLKDSRIYPAFILPQELLNFTVVK